MNSCLRQRGGVPTVELDFDPATLLLTEARFGTLGGGQTPGDDPLRTIRLALPRD